MRVCKQRKQLSSSGVLSTSLLVVGEEEEIESYRLITVGEQVRKEIELRFHKSEVNASYVFPRQETAKHRPNLSSTGPLSLLLKTQPQKYRLIKHTKANSLAKRPSKSPLKRIVHTPSPDLHYLPRLPSTQLRKTLDPVLDLRARLRPHSRLATKDLRRQRTEVHTLHNSSNFLSFYLES